MSKNKKAQLTLFIVIGIIIAIAAFISIRVFLLKGDLGVEPEIISEEVPQLTVPVKEYVENCIRDIALDALIAISEHGGYIDINDPYLTDETFNINANEPYNSDAIALDKESKDYIPYWYYLESEVPCSDCKINSKMVNLTRIKEQIDRYVEREIPGCINKFSSFKETGIDIEDGDIRIDSIIRYDSLLINAEYPLKIKKGESEAAIDEFQIELDIYLPEMWLLSYLITYSEINYQFLEYITKTLVDYSSAIDENKLPPVYDVDELSTKVTWNKDDVKTMLIELFSARIPQIQMNKTKDAKQIIAELPEYQNLYNLLFVEFLNESLNISFPDLKVTLFYNLFWDMYFDITPSNGKTLEPNSFVSEPMMGFYETTYQNVYEFFYDYSFPVLVIIEDNRSLKSIRDDNYNFMFALEVNLLNNRNLLQWNLGYGTQGAFDPSVNFSTSGTTQTAGNCTGNEPNVKCKESGITYSTLLACSNNCVKTTSGKISYASSLMCGSNQLLTGNITIKTKKKKDSSPAPDINVMYRCGNYKSCVIGKTRLNDKGEAELISKFPLCYGEGYVIIESKDYVKDAYKLKTTYGMEDKIIFEVQEYKTMEASVKKRYSTDSSINDPEDIYTKDYISINIEEISEGLYSFIQPNRQTLIFDKATGGDSKTKLKITPGKYKINAQYMDYEGAVLKANCYRYCSSYDDDGDCDGWDTKPNEDSEINPLIRGGLTFDGTDAVWEVKQEDLNNNNKVEFYITYSDKPNCAVKPGGKDQFCQIGNCITYGEFDIKERSEKFSSELMPRFY